MSIHHTRVTWAHARARCSHRTATALREPMQGSKRFIVVLVMALSASLLSACAAIYKPAPFWGASGYSSTDIDTSTVSVNYLTGATADPGTARDYALYRCAEIALERGFDGFVVLKGGAFSTSGRYGTTTSSTIVMRMFKGAAPDKSALPAGAQGVYEARAVKARLEAGIKR